MECTKEKDGIRYKELSEALNRTICKNIQALIDARGLSRSAFCRELSKENVSVSRPHLSRILNEQQYVSAAFLLSCCDYFGVTVENLVSPDFDADEYVYNDTKEHKDYLTVEQILKVQKIDKRGVQESLKVNQDVSEFIAPYFQVCNGCNTELITNPNAAQFTGYLQDYYCYYYPTDSATNKTNEKILSGMLKLEATGDYCRAVLKIDLKTKDEMGRNIYKEYVGYAAISTTVNSVNCIMYSDDLCEFCFVMFRYFRINFSKIDCRIAEVLASSSATEGRRPTVLRMFLSREEIAEDDLKIIAPSFSLNYSTIAISEENLKSIGKVSDVYANIIEAIKKEDEVQAMYFLKEENICNLAYKYLKNKYKVGEFIMNMRASAYSYRYNKVSNKADDMVRNVLISKGYFLNPITK